MGKFLALALMIAALLVPTAGAQEDYGGGGQGTNCKWEWSLGRWVIFEYIGGGVWNPVFPIIYCA